MYYYYYYRGGKSMWAELDFETWFWFNSICVSVCLNKISKNYTSEKQTSMRVMIISWTFTLDIMDVIMDDDISLIIVNKCFKVFTKCNII